mmetsp:Transcript_38143/g.96724  ORF Transcript_38143/g.96724 Transcript_38143/m.96724 type:complete len:206 (+) Transcript_38143:1022-1639(+)
MSAKWLEARNVSRTCSWSCGKLSLWIASAWCLRAAWLLSKDTSARVAAKTSTRPGASPEAARAASASAVGSSGCDDGGRRNCSSSQATARACLVAPPATSSAECRRPGGSVGRLPSRSMRSKPRGHSSSSSLCSQRGIEPAKTKVCFEAFFSRNFIKVCASRPTLCASSSSASSNTRQRNVSTWSAPTLNICCTRPGVPMAMWAP